MKRIVCLILSMVLILGLTGVSASAEGTLKLVFSEESAAPGEEVEVLLSLENNPGVKGLSCEVEYNEDVLTYQGYTAKTTVGVWSMDTFEDDHALLWYYDGFSSGQMLTYEGSEMIALRFKVADNADPGRYSVEFVFDPEWHSVTGVKDNNVYDITDFETVHGAVIVPEPAPALENGFYLIGQNGWTVADIDPAQKFETNPNNENEYLLETTLAKDDGIKVVKVENGAIAAWYPDGMDNQYVVDEAHAGAKTIYFHPWHDDAWAAFGGYIWIDGPLPSAEMYGSSLTLKGNVGLNFYVVPSEELLEDEDAYVKLNDTRISFADATKQKADGETLYMFTMNLHAKQMNDVVTLRVYNGQDNLVKLIRRSTGEDITETGYPFTVQTYIQRTLEDEAADEDLKALMRAMSDYGRLAQIMFNYKTEELAEQYGDLSTVTEAELAAYDKKVTQKAPGVSFVAGSLVLESETTIQLYFKVDEGEIGDYTFKVGKSVKEPKAKTVQVGDDTIECWMIEIPNVAAKDLDKVYSTAVTNAAGVKVLVVKYSALSYAYSTLQNSTDEKLINLVKGIYLYNQAANVYFAK